MAGHGCKNWLKRGINKGLAQIYTLALEKMKNLGVLLILILCGCNYESRYGEDQEPANPKAGYCGDISTSECFIEDSNGNPIPMDVYINKYAK